MDVLGHSDDNRLNQNRIQLAHVLCPFQKARNISDPPHGPDETFLQGVRQIYQLGKMYRDREL